MKVIAGKNSLDRVITWPYIGLADEMGDWVLGGELLFYTGIGMHQEDDLIITLIDTCNRKNLAGIVFLISNYFPVVHEPIIAHADELDFPLFELQSSESKLVEVTKEIGNCIIARQHEIRSFQAIVDKILFAEAADNLLLIEQAKYYGYDLTIPQQIALMEFQDLDTYVQVNRQSISPEKAKNYIINMAMNFFRQYYKSGLVTDRQDRIIAILPVSVTQDAKAIIKNLDEICLRLKRYNKGLELHVGVGGIYATIHDIKKSYIEAERVVSVMSYENKKQVMEYADIGLYKLFFEFRDMTVIRQYCTDTLGKLIDDSVLMETLTTYYKHRFNLNKTAQELSIHRNTLLYRLGRVEKITGIDINKQTDLSNLIVSAFLWNTLKQTQLRRDTENTPSDKAT